MRPIIISNTEYIKNLVRVPSKYSYSTNSIKGKSGTQGYNNWLHFQSLYLINIHIYPHILYIMHAYTHIYNIVHFK